MADFVQPYGREGAWTSSHSFHYASAHLFHREWAELTSRIRGVEASLRDDNREMEEEYLEGFVHSETRGLHQNAYRLGTAAHLFACMAIEGFINAYGTRRLGADYYKRNLERLGITEKLSVILLVCGLARKDKNDLTLRSIRMLFDQRNSIVHPKSKEIRDLASVEEYQHPATLPITKAIDTLEAFIEEMCTLDVDIHRDFEFNVPEVTDET